MYKPMCSEISRPHVTHPLLRSGGQWTKVFCSQWKYLYSLTFLCLRRGRKAPSCGEALCSELWQHVRRVLPEQRAVHAAGGHQRTPLQVRSGSVTASVCSLRSSCVITNCSSSFQVWQRLLWPQVWQGRAGHQANGRGADSSDCFLRWSAGRGSDGNSVPLLQMVRPAERTFRMFLLVLKATVICFLEAF